MRARILSATLLSLWVLPPFLAALLAKKPASALIAAVFYCIIAASIFTHKLLQKPDEDDSVAKPVARFRQNLKLLVWCWVMVLTCFQLAIAARILAERGQLNWLPIREVSGYFVESLSIFIPALRNFPLDMAKHGFSDTASVVTDSYALAYVAALLNLSISVLIIGWLFLSLLVRREIASIPHGFDQVEREKILAMILCWPLMLALYVYLVFIDTDVSATVRRKEHLAYFETSELQLYFRTLLGTGLSTIGACSLIGVMAFGISIFISERLGNPQTAS